MAKGEGIAASKLGESKRARQAHSLARGTEPGSAQQAWAQGLCCTGACQ